MKTLITIPILLTLAACNDSGSSSSSTSIPTVDTTPDTTIVDDTTTGPEVVKNYSMTSVPLEELENYEDEGYVLTYQIGLDGLLNYYKKVDGELVKFADSFTRAEYGKGFVNVVSVRGAKTKKYDTKTSVTVAKGMMQPVSWDHPMELTNCASDRQYSTTVPSYDATNGFRYEGHVYGQIKGFCLSADDSSNISVSSDGYNTSNVHFVSGMEEVYECNDKNTLIYDSTHTYFEEHGEDSQSGLQTYMMSNENPNLVAGESIASTIGAWTIVEGDSTLAFFSEHRPELGKRNHYVFSENISSGVFTGQAYINRTNLEVAELNGASLVVNDESYLYNIVDGKIDIYKFAFDGGFRDLPKNGFQTGTGVVTRIGFDNVIPEINRTDIAPDKLEAWSETQLIAYEGTDFVVLDYTLVELGRKDMSHCSKAQITSHIYGRYVVNCDDKILITDSRFETLEEINIPNSVGMNLVYLPSTDL